MGSSSQSSLLEPAFFRAHTNPRLSEPISQFGPSSSPSFILPRPGIHEKATMDQVPSSGAILQQPQPVNVKKKGRQLNDLPSDVLGNILSRCSSITDADQLRMSCHALDGAYRDHQFYILRRIIALQYPESSEIYELAAVIKHGHVSGPRAIYSDTPLHVYYQPWKDTLYKPAPLSISHRWSSRQPKTVVLHKVDLFLLAYICRIIDQWVSVIPLVRFRNSPPFIRRGLRRSEEVRLMRAVVRWWRYSIHFQGKLGWHLSLPWDSFSTAFTDHEPGSMEYLDGEHLVSSSNEDPETAPSSFQSDTFSLNSVFSAPPSNISRFSDDFDLEEDTDQAVLRYTTLNEHSPEFQAFGSDTSTGRAFMRTLSTSHLMELRDLFACAWDMVASDICPSQERLEQEIREAIDEGEYYRSSQIDGWGCEDTGRNFVIVNTYLKLPPDDLLLLWQERINSATYFPSPYTNARIQERARHMVPRLALTRQSLSSSLDYVLRERSIQDLYDRSLAYEMAESLDIELNMWQIWWPPGARLRYGGILDFPGDGDMYYQDEPARYDDDAIPSGRRPDYGSFSIDRATWTPPTVGWTFISARTTPLTVDGDDGNKR